MAKITLLFLALLAGSAHAGSGFSIRGGGDELGLTFTNAYFFALDTLAEQRPDLGKALDDAGARHPSPSRQILISDQPLARVTEGAANELVAYARPAENLVWINRAGWAKTRHHRIRQAIALHQMLRLQGLETETSFPYSAAFLSSFRLRADANVLRTGQDPGLPSWKTSAVSCRGSGSAPYEIKAMWNFGDRRFTLSFLFPLGSPGERAPVRVAQTATTVSSPKEEGSVLTTNGQSFAARGYRGPLLARNETFFEENVNASERAIWSWRGGAPRTKLSETKITSQEGETTRYSEQNAGAAEASLCEEKEITGADFMTRIADPAASAFFDKVNARALFVVAGEWAAATCEGNSCRAARQDLEEQKRSFAGTWAEGFAKLKLSFSASAKTKGSR